MKRFISSILLICFFALSVLGASSCDFNPDNVGNSGNISNDSNGGNNGSSGGGNSDGDHAHVDENNDEICDDCLESVIVVIDFYVVNDLHGKFCDTGTQPGVDELSTYLKNKKNTDDNVVILSSGDMWQGTAESNLTGGVIITEWMNELDFVSMTLGNHEFDWGEDAIRENLEVAEFPFLAINIYDLDTKKLADYCTPSVMIERDGIQIGIIGAIGDCYSSISSDMVENVEFKVGYELTALVRAESEKLRSEGADLIVYSLHDGYGESSSSTGSISSSNLSSYYNQALSNGYVDVVFESHSHQYYTLVDSYDVYHVQGGGENYGISHVEIQVNSVNGENSVSEAGVIRSSAYSSLADDPAIEALEDKYGEVIHYAYSSLGTVSDYYSSSEIEDVVAELYLEAGIEKWGSKYDIILGGGYLKSRSPYDLTAGTKTYADILSLFPFDNRLVLCSVSGSKLLSNFINTNNSDYHVSLSEYGESISISYGETYYIVVDTYTSLFAPNGLTVIEYYDDTTFARDLLADAIEKGKFYNGHDSYTLTSIADALQIGNSLPANVDTYAYHYVKGTVKDTPNATWGNLYLVDEYGNEIYVYGLYDEFNNRYDVMSDKPQKGDTVILYSQIFKYVNTTTSEEKIELKNAVLIELNP